MNPTAINPTAIVAYLALFASVAFLFVLAALILGRFLRAQDPSPGKLEIYECGETPIGPGFVQFDLRFYVVALLFIIFEVEVAFFFPWATVFGKAAVLRNPVRAAVEAGSAGAALSPKASAALKEMGVPSPSVPDPKGSLGANADQVARSARQLTLMAIVDIGVFFGVLMLGFAYLWNRGDLNWVRASSSSALNEVAQTSGPLRVVGVLELAEMAQQDEK